MVAIRCEFLQGTFQAASPGRYVEPEWPPHPARLHAALVASAFASGGGRMEEDARAALEWLEHQAPPGLAASERCPERSAPIVFVPRNLTRAEVGDVISRIRRGETGRRQSGRVPRTFPTSVPGDEPVWFIWDAEAGAHQPVLERLVAEVQYLGSSRSPVCCDVVDDPPPVALRPHPSRTTTSLRVPIPGSTERLIEATREREFPSPALGALVAYGRVAETEPMAADAGAFDELLIFELERRFPLDASHSATIGRAWRSAVLSQAGDDAPEMLHGHGAHPHAAFIPLPVVGPRDASGAIAGVGVALPARATKDEREAVFNAARAVDRLAIRRQSAYRLAPPDPLNARRTVLPARWIGPAERWTTATPVVLDQYPKRRSADAMHAAVRQTFVNALLPEPEEIETALVSWMGGAPPAGSLRGGEVPGGLQLHMRVRFSKPVRGPLMAGRGRYLGVGLFAPISNEP